MNRLEKIMSEYPDLHFVFTGMLPDVQGAMIMNHTVYVNKNRSYQQNLSDVTEEIGHYKTTVGNIWEQKTRLDYAQERQARRVGSMLLVTLDGLIECYENRIETKWEIAEYFECDPKEICKSINIYKAKYGEQFTYHGYQFDLTSGLNIHKAGIVSNH